MILNSPDDGLVPFVYDFMFGRRTKDGKCSHYIDEENIQKLITDKIKAENKRVIDDLPNLFISMTQHYNDDTKQHIIETIQHLNQLAAIYEIYNKK